MRTSSFLDHLDTRSDIMRISRSMLTSKDPTAAKANPTLFA